MTVDELCVSLTARGCRAITLGHPRDDASVADLAREVARRWEAAGGVVLDVVDWPERAASWLRQARRFTAGGPDAWVVCGGGPGWDGLRGRLPPGWAPERTYFLAA
ncbi:hypothetical protein [Amycolatopsis sp. H20-H5]|uniref:hypothetical protein n=1 Tax=Amycolatopsis sp. H20-H5 TaxID=3046309 RepID=UPI002DB69C65|nr:hypothetical protein [Amycolatopsis sp. H20-H5]MEC3978505.1 hypothetical protein [Amycolatopsis sp. H20-H5]